MERLSEVPIDWHARHYVAIAFQILSLLGSGFIVVRFFQKRKWRRRDHTFATELLCLCAADIVWTASHLANHLDALIVGEVTEGASCRAMGFLTHLGIGWELTFIILISLHQCFLVFHATRNGKRYKPNKSTQVIAFLIAVLFPPIWWGAFGLPYGAYASTGYFCWVRLDDTATSLMFADLPLLICFAVATACDIAIIAELLRHVVLNPTWAVDLQPFRRAIFRCVFFIGVYVMWIHPYLTLTILSMVGKDISRGFWIYFLVMINSLGIMNFLAWFGVTWSFKRTDRDKFTMSNESVSSDTSLRPVSLVILP